MEVVTVNRETPIDRLAEGVVVSNEDFFVRSHFPTPAIDTTTWLLRVSGLVKHPLSLDLGELINMPAHTMLLTLECAGNGRSLFSPPIEGEQWGLGAVSTAEWTGVLLSDLLERAAVHSAGRELVFRGADSFERSMRLNDVLEHRILLAYAMNGATLPAEHGHPLRAVVPGWYSVSDVKWLTAIEVIGEPFTGYFQTARYIYDWGDGPPEPVRHQRVRSLITHPLDGDEVGSGAIAIRGLAWSGATSISRVEVRVGADGWRQARLLGDGIPYSWRPWELITSIGHRGETRIQSRATDAAGNVQPERAAWNRFGYGNNSIQTVIVRAS